ncbi:hypothetical protein C8R44DRAFT_828517 [Mycena epipterygia]|nr:hypothetical protein C8R44DRAFT_828517 [Mycena epipterygia]
MQPKQQERVPGSRRRHTHLALMDGKTITHQLNGALGNSVVHTFHARTTYCLQTVQWSCGCLIGWNKCYHSESSSQVLKIIDNIWAPHPESRPGFVAYDIWCNPAPMNGSQPDLIFITVDDNGQTHTSQAFNTETAEWLNAWLNGYEAQLRQMSDVNYDFSVHDLMLLYKELVDKKVAKKDQGPTEELWDMVDSTD